MKLLFVNIILVIISTVVLYLPFIKFRFWRKERCVLFVAIPSSPDHIEQRKSLRETWLQLVPDNLYKYKFIIGNKMCNIHPQDRKSEYSCESLNITIPKGITENIILYVNSLNTSDQKAPIALGFSFTVNHPVKIDSLGVRQDMLIPGSGQIVRVNLHFLSGNIFNLSDPASKLLSVTFHSDSSFGGVNIKRYIHKKLSNRLTLRKGFEGMIIVEKVSGFDQERNCTYLTHWEHGNLLTVLNVLTTRSFETNVDSYCILPSFGFTIAEIPELEKHIKQSEERRVNWSKYINEAEQKILLEAKQYKDILFVNTVDVYRNLPQKIFLFFKWLFEKYDVDYVLKTDDDTFVDILKIQEELETSSRPGWDWWSCFRIDWPVKRAGKWREMASYKEEIYPPFPTGAGYVLSKRALQWLENRLDTLSVAYQGEDVAMGIWLEGMNPSRHAGDVCYWACVETRHPRSCNVMQLNVTGVYETWREYRRQAA